ncbi:MAG: ATP-grasp domain-containing protein, partial [Flavobacteriaceae bacterium]|nr:ATP-grasp domain-containing protein [Flavobacteriaceae bacterium]
IEFGVPMIVKPREGSGSEGVVKILNENKFNEYAENLGNELLVQPLLGNDDEEYTTSAFCDGFGGYSAIISLKRRLSKQGITESAEVVVESEIEKCVGELCKILKPIGPTNFQFRKHLGKFYLLEVNPRISSATSIRKAFGYNESKMVIEYYLDGKIPKQPIIKLGKAIRYIEDYIIYV